MKKMILISAALFFTVGAGAWAEGQAPTPGVHMTRDQAIQHRDAMKQKHLKHAKPPRAVEGTAVKGATKVSPEPAKNNNQ